MTYNSKKNIISMAAGTIWILAYIIYVFAGKSPAADDIQAWAKLMLIFIGIGAAAQIVIMILFHIAFAIGVAAKEHMQGRAPGENVERIVKSSILEDERDRMIGFKSSRAGKTAVGLGFIAALIFLAFGIPVIAALHIIFGVCAAGALLEGGMGIYLHERGV
jgi:uncharacterized membrane protein